MDNIDVREFMLAVITISPEKVKGAGCPIFIADNEEQQQRISLLLARILGGITHDLENGVYVIVKH